VRSWKRPVTWPRWSRSCTTPSCRPCSTSCRARRPCRCWCRCSCPSPRYARPSDSTSASARGCPRSTRAPAGRRAAEPAKRQRPSLPSGRGCPRPRRGQAGPDRALCSIYVLLPERSPIGHDFDQASGLKSLESTENRVLRNVVVVGQLRNRRHPFVGCPFASGQPCP
jgi:hypothetical protein